MKQKALVVIAVLVSVGTVEAATNIAVVWLPNATSVVDVVEPSPGAIRLGNAYTGSASGAVSLPMDGDWTLTLTAETDETYAFTNEVMDVGINQAHVWSFTNWPVGGHERSAVVPLSGSSFTFQLEFSSPTNRHHAHLVLHPGMVAPSLREPRVVAFSAHASENSITVSNLTYTASNVVESTICLATGTWAEVRSFTSTSNAHTLNDLPIPEGHCQFYRIITRP